MSYTTFVQWKGTNLCMDFNCPECGEGTHFDGWFAYYIECPSCKSVFEMPTDLPIKKAEPSTGYSDDRSILRCCDEC